MLAAENGAAKSMNILNFREYSLGTLLRTVGSRIFESQYCNSTTSLLRYFLQKCSDSRKIDTLLVNALSLGIVGCRSERDCRL